MLAPVSRRVETRNNYNSLCVEKSVEKSVEKAMEIFRTTSPESGTFSFGWRRKSLMRAPNVSHSPEDKSFLTSSLPTRTLSAELALIKSPKFSNSLVVDDDSSNLSPPRAFRIVPRPRSASLYANHASTTALLQVQGNKRKTLRTLTRSRPSSARFGRSRSESLSLEQEATTGTYKVENAFAKIKSQLAQLSEEDAILQERLDRLTLEISYMQKCVSNLHYTQVHAVPSSPQETTAKSWSSPPLSVPVVKVSGSQSDILSIAEESWEEEEEREYKNETDQQEESKSKYHNLIENSGHSFPEIRKQESLGSCGSLADSEGSLSPGRQTCRIVVVDHDKCLLSPRPHKFNYEASPNSLKFNYEAGPSPLNFNYEDDVFFT